MFVRGGAGLVIENKCFDEERALYGVRDVQIKGCIFDGPADGESALKECENVSVEDSRFHLRYPFWHTRNAVIRRCEMSEGCRAALWYDENISLESCEMNGIKALRECENVSLSGCSISSPEFAWRCRGISISDCRLVSEYPFFECRDMQVMGLSMTGKYSFQYAENVTISKSNLQTKDAFWHSKNVTVYDSVVQGEYLGWYSENLRLVRCRIIGTQPLCYCKGLVLEDCTMEGTDLSFENSEVTASVEGDIISVKNPVCGVIEADSIGEVILDANRTPVTLCEIKTRTILRKGAAV
ncbi:MAG: DUF3737 family protein [Clostridia bacterium]|nr:DUF3737 family protein [Clostridia bacterium]